ncbi:MAG: PTS sugar transporter subunit IIC [Paraclostridium bifermentans]|uniref:PTS sugar transporter subunit IIC n=1 Tax=Clostridia TaxID=186801 RepID=UPI00241EBD93|nr:MULTISPECIES: PTS sugar transporter subunit IIC [Clostridiaceae]MBS5955020.1 PTS sugar transporter subunit IIC [Paraclostridium bifermentans]CAI3245073.1 phosphotransferase system (PTS) lichenan-specific enzyme IIC component [Clostridium neonatale]CAI3630651.1 phosphotransferase system (PTS) lichenan-specific enzyme IIC component [Clostridium neonatale]
MENFTNKIQSLLMPLAQKINNNRYLNAMKDGFLTSMPLLILGSVFLLFANIPINGYSGFMESLLGSGWSDYFMIPFQTTMEIMTLFVIIGMAKSLARYYSVDDIGAITLALVSFLILTPNLLGKDGAFGIPKANLGASGLFLGMLATALAVEIYRSVLKKGWIIKLPEAVPENVSKSFSSLIPGIFVVLVFMIIRIGFMLTSFNSAQNFIYTVLQTPLLALGSTLPAQLIAQFTESFLWSLGIHGGNVVGSVMDPIRMTLMGENAHAFALGEKLPNIIQYQFGANFISIGGSGTAIGLAIAGFFFTKSKQYKALGKLAFIPSLFNISEPLVFGLPIVLNPMLIIPFIITPLITTVLTYFVMYFNIVPAPNGINIPWTTPPIISGFLVSGWRGSVWQIVLIVLSTCIYTPFLKILDNKALNEEKEKEIDQA